MDIKFKDFSPKDLELIAQDMFVYKGIAKKQARKGLTKRMLHIWVNVQIEAALDGLREEFEEQEVN